MKHLILPVLTILVSIAVVAQESPSPPTVAEDLLLPQPHPWQGWPFHGEKIRVIHEAALKGEVEAQYA